MSEYAINIYIRKQMKNERLYVHLTLAAGYALFFLIVFLIIIFVLNSTSMTLGSSEPRKVFPPRYRVKIAKKTKTKCCPVKASVYRTQDHRIMPLHASRGRRVVTSHLLPDGGHVTQQKSGLFTSNFLETSSRGFALLEL